MFDDPNLFCRKPVSSGIHPYTCEFNVCSLKFEMNVMPLHKIRVNKISLFLVNRYAVLDF